MKKLQIAVGIIRNENNEIFITRRAADAHMANKLEFPGGKIEMGETPEQAVVRELQEEVGITPQHFSLFEIRTADLHGVGCKELGIVIADADDRGIRGLPCDLCP